MANIGDFLFSTKRKTSNDPDSYDSGVNMLQLLGGAVSDAGRLKRGQDPAYLTHYQGVQQKAAETAFDKWYKQEQIKQLADTNKRQMDVAQLTALGRGVSPMIQATDPQTGQPQFDPSTGRPVMVPSNMTVAGGNLYGLSPLRAQTPSQQLAQKRNENYMAPQEKADFDLRNKKRDRIDTILNRKLSPVEAKALAQAETLNTDIETMLSGVGTDAEYKGYAPFGLGDTKGQKFQESLKRTKNTLLYLRSGAQINEKEYKRLSSLLPSIFKKGEVDKEALNTFKGEFSKVVRNIKYGTLSDEDAGLLEEYQSSKTGGAQASSVDNFLASV